MSRRQSSRSCLFQTCADGALSARNGTGSSLGASRFPPSVSRTVGRMPVTLLDLLLNSLKLIIQSLMVGSLLTERHKGGTGLCMVELQRKLAMGELIQCSLTEHVDADGGHFCECVSQEGDDSVVSIFNPLCERKICFCHTFPFIVYIMI